MTKPLLHAVGSTDATDLSDFLPADPAALSGPYANFLRATRKSPHTISKYLLVVRQLRDFLVAEGYPTAVVEIRRIHVQQFIVRSLEERKASTATTRFYALRGFFTYLLGDDEISVHPMEGMKPPPVTAPPVAVLTEEEMAALYATCSTNSFRDRRDAAIMAMFNDTGARLAEITGLTTEGIGDGVATVMGKGSKGSGPRPRVVQFGANTSRLLDRYLRVRARHPHANSASLWLGRRGPMTVSGLRDAIEFRAEQAGVEGVHPHRFRHTFAHEWLSEGGQEVDLMRLAGWESRQMLSRYGASSADARAAESYRKRLSPVDRVMENARKNRGSK